MSPADARVLLPDAGHKMVKRDQPQLARSLGAAATTVLEAHEPEAPDTEPQLGLALWELEAGMCRFAVNEVPAAPGPEFPAMSRIGRVEMWRGDVS